MKFEMSCPECKKEYKFEYNGENPELIDEDIFICPTIDGKGYTVRCIHEKTNVEIGFIKKGV